MECKQDLKVTGIIIMPNDKRMKPWPAYRKAIANKDPLIKINNERRKMYKIK